MAIPLFSLLFLTALLLVIGAAIAIIYLLIYQKRINQALLSQQTLPHRMLSPHRLIILLFIIILLITTVASYFIGYKTAYDRFEQQTAIEYMDTNTFYAKIIAIQGDETTGNAITVQGLPINDVNYRQAFSFAIYGETKLEWQQRKIDLDAFSPGDLVAITFTGEPSQGSPAVLSHVTKIQLLEENIETLI